MERILIPQKNNPNFVRDLHSKALFPADHKEADEYMVKTRLITQAKKDRERMDNLEEEIKHLKEAINILMLSHNPVIG